MRMQLIIVSVSGFSVFNLSNKDSRSRLLHRCDIIKTRCYLVAWFILLLYSL